MVKERPILFSAPMVRAILDGRKTQTRRVVKVQPPAATREVTTFHHPDPRLHYWAFDGGSLLDWAYPCPHGEPGDLLWVRETHRAVYPQDPTYNGGAPIEYDYRATYKPGDRLCDPTRWTPSIHMPRAACRLMLELTDVRVERLNDCSEADAIAEGVEPYAIYGGKPASWKGAADMHAARDTARGAYRDLWDSINGAGAWAANPWVWVIEFKRIKA